MLPKLSYFLMFKFIHKGMKMTESTQEKEKGRKRDKEIGKWRGERERLGGRERTNLGFPSLSENSSYHWVGHF